MLWHMRHSPWHFFCVSYLGVKTSSSTAADTRRRMRRQVDSSLPEVT